MGLGELFSGPADAFGDDMGVGDLVGGAQEGGQVACHVSAGCVAFEGIAAEGLADDVAQAGGEVRAKVCEVGDFHVADRAHELEWVFVFEELFTREDLPQHDADTEEVGLGARVCFVGQLGRQIRDLALH